MEEKLKKHFGGMIVKKTASLGLFSSLSIPSFIRDWFLKRYADKNGDVNVNFISEKVKEILPSKDDWNKLLNNVLEHKPTKFLARIKINQDIKSGTVSFELPDFGVGIKDTLILPNVWVRIKKSFLASSEEVWGIVELGYLKAEVSPTKKGLLLLNGFQAFCPYNIDLAYYKAVRGEFDLDEWLDVLLAAIDYNPSAFKSTSDKLYMLTRLLPFVEKRLNLVELAPKGTGKSYLFSQISKYGWLASGGVMTRAKMFYDMNKKEEGLVSSYDYVALDEIATIKFPDASEMQGAMKGYLESGAYTVGNKSGKGDAGVVLLGNIPIEKMSSDINMFESLPQIFSESALIDRFHGFIEGWKIPRMSEELKANGWALNTEYFSEILHAFREDISAADIVNELLEIPKNSDTRDVSAIKRITSAYLKLLFPHWKNAHEVDIEQFKKYCLEPALNMRGIIKKQLCIIDKEYLNYPLPEVIEKK